MGKKKLLVVICCVCAICFMCSTCYIGIHMYNDHLERVAIENAVSQSEPSSAKEQDVIHEEESSSPGIWKETVRTETAGLDGELDADSPVRRIDFSLLQKTNPDIYAWIEIPGTNIDYPILQCEDDAFYLTHDLRREYSSHGSIYTEKKNSRDFSDPNTVVYGHNMKDQTMFKHLHLFREPDFFSENEYIYVYTPSARLTYHIFMAYQYDKRHILNSFDFASKEGYGSYLDSLLSVRSADINRRDGVFPSVDDHILTLSTCVGHGEQYRYLVQAVLEEEVPVE